MRNGEGLQLIPYIIVWLTIIFCNICAIFIRRATRLWEGLSYWKSYWPFLLQEHLTSFEAWFPQNIARESQWNFAHMLSWYAQCVCVCVCRASTRIFARGCRDIARGCTRRAFGAQRAPQERSHLLVGFAPPEKFWKNGAIWRILSGVWWTNEVYKICFKNDWIMKIFFFIIVFLKNLINILLFYFFRFLGVAKFATICRRCIQCRDGKNKSSAVWSTHTYYIQIMTSHNYLALTWHTEI